MATGSVVLLSVNFLCCGCLHKTKAGPAEWLLLWDSVGGSAVSWGGHTSWADSCHEPCLTPHQPSRSFSAVASCRNLSCSPYKLKIGNLSGLKMPVVQSRWVVNCACGGGWREAAWCHGCLLYPRLVCSCWLFSSTEQHDTIHFHIQIKVEHFKAIFTLFVCF